MRFVDHSLQQKMLERKIAVKRMKIAAIFGAVFFAVTFFNYGWITHSEDLFMTRVFLGAALFMNLLLLIVYRQMLRGWRKEDLITRDD